MHQTNLFCNDRLSSLTKLAKLAKTVWFLDILSVWKTSAKRFTFSMTTCEGTSSQLLNSQKKTNIGKTSTLPFVADAERAVTAPAVGNLLQSSNLQHIRSLPTVPVKHFCWLGHFEESFGRVSSRLFSLVLRISISKFLATK